MESEDGLDFVKKLAYFVRTHERALANALQSQQRQRLVKNGKEQSPSGGSSSSAVASSSSSPMSLTELLSRPYFSLSSRSIKPAKLTLTPHHLFYLLSKFEDLGVDVGPMTVRLENLHSHSGPMNYVSFIGNAPKSKGRQADTESIRSVSSIRSVMSSVSSVWSTLTMSNSAAKAEKQMAQHREDLRYLYSCFTKIPALRLAPDHRARLVSGFEEFPFDTAVPLFAFKNLSALEISDLDFRQFHGWDRLAEQLRSLTVKRAGVDDPIDLLQGIVLDDAERRRKRSSKTQVPTTPSTPGLPWPTASPKVKHQELSRSLSSPVSSLIEQRRVSISDALGIARGETSEGKRPAPAARRDSNSPPRPSASRNGSGSLQRPHTGRSSVSKHRRSSGSSGSSTHESTPRHSTSDLLSFNMLPSTKWRFLRHLSLAENGLTHLSAASLAPVASTLQSLDLSGNLFAEIPEALASLTHLRALNLSCCMIESLQSLARNPLPAITTLNLRSNRLLSLAGIERLYSLERLDLRDNRLHDPTELARLTGIPDICDIYVLKNPFTRTHSNYRVTIFNLFRSTPGHVEDITIDTLGPIYTEKKQLVDRAPEDASQRPVVRPPLEDEEEMPRPAVVAAAASATADMNRALLAADHPGHQRSSSDLGPRPKARRRKVPRRRIVELSQAEFGKPTSAVPPAERALPELIKMAPMPDTPEIANVQPATPGTTPRDSEESVATSARPALAIRPKLETAFASPTHSPKIRNLSDNDEPSPPVSPVDLVGPPTDVYRQKIEAMKDELGPNWLSALNEERFGDSVNRVPRDASLGPASRSPTVTAPTAVDQRGASSRSVSVGGRTLG